MKSTFKKFIETAREGQTFFAVETGTKYKIQKIEKKKTHAIEYNKRDNAGENEEVIWYNDDNYKVIY